MTPIAARTILVDLWSDPATSTISDFATFCPMSVWRRDFGLPKVDGDFHFAALLAATWDVAPWPTPGDDDDARADGGDAPDDDGDDDDASLASRATSFFVEDRYS